jgi:sulfite reductase (ferredoxin)
MAEIGLVGIGVDEYQLWLGGSPHLTRLATPHLERMPLQKLEATLEPMLLAWKEAGVRTPFGDFIARLAPEQLEALLPATS